MYTALQEKIRNIIQKLILFDWKYLSYILGNIIFIIFLFMEFSFLTSLIIFINIFNINKRIFTLNKKIEKIFLSNQQYKKNNVTDKSSWRSN